jgi:prepilin peptidase CpaA
LSASVQVLTGGVLALTLLVAVITDLRSRTIPEWVVWPALAVVLAIRFAWEHLGDASSGLWSGLLGGALATVWFGVFALRRSLGWGDVKLAAVAGAAFGYPKVFEAVIFISLAGAFQALFSLIWRGKLSDTVRGVLARDGAKDSPKQHIPYGVAIALGSLGAMWWDGNAF